MRTEFYAELDRLTAELGGMCALAASTMECVTDALVRADREAAHQCGVEVARLGRLHHCAGERAFAMLSMQAPGAHALRVLMSAVPIAADANRMGALAANIAREQRRRRPAGVPPVAVADFAEMGRQAVALTEFARRVVFSGVRASPPHQHVLELRKRVIHARPPESHRHRADRLCTRSVRIPGQAHSEHAGQHPAVVEFDQHGDAVDGRPRRHPHPDAHRTNRHGRTLVMSPD
ncbi:MAG: hypothetical protein HYZ39_11380 [Mycolicibacterium cosmeticum]|nr:hypothetical protein [Mycolicibacterium cosmeticum]